MSFSALVIPMDSSLFFLNDTATTDIYTLSLHDALPIWGVVVHARHPGRTPIRGSDERGLLRPVRDPTADGPAPYRGARLAPDRADPDRCLHCGLAGDQARSAGSDGGGGSDRSATFRVGREQKSDTPVGRALPTGV